MERHSGKLVPLQLQGMAADTARPLTFSSIFFCQDTGRAFAMGVGVFRASASPIRSLFDNSGTYQWPSRHPPLANRLRQILIERTANPGLPAATDY